MALQPVLVVLVPNTFVNHGADATEITAAVAAFWDVATIAAAHPRCCAIGHLGALTWDFADVVDFDLWVPYVLCCGHWDGGGERDSVGEGVGEKHCCSGVVVFCCFECWFLLVGMYMEREGSEDRRDARESLYESERRTIRQRKTQSDKAGNKKRQTSVHVR